MYSNKDIKSKNVVPMESRIMVTSREREVIQVEKKCIVQFLT
jgi:hypothetical protein